MLSYLVRRVVGAVVVLFVLSVAVFAIFYLLPGDPAQLVCGVKTCSADRLALVRQKLGLDQPVAMQYWQFVTGLVVGRDVSAGPTVLHCPAPCLGFSFQTDEPVLALITDRLPVSLSLTLGAMVLWLTIGVGGGVLSALRRGRFVDRATTALVLGGMSVPVFVSGLLLLMVFCVWLRWLPFPSYVPLGSDPAAWAANLVLPWFALALVQAATYARLTRTSMLETLAEDHIRTARAYGLRESRVVGRHALRGALTPLATMLAIDVGAVLTSAALTETLFGLPGLGQLLVQSVNTLDLPVVVGLMLLAGFAIVIGNVVADLLYAVLDRRVSLT
ncbi:peptide/nickel transport system permease protein [Streptoalloteichus tenebrarius]|uniref:Peptide/nickel transport system permease protein n=1 Tax=Streptoalloteichus tenebrarius (strain ATCC 17920 / DSM 40477 / JCM 4838 / CBS 697.72 / NBRC 16177 / NCIMB 11028 / NRRL B-12390 / A12253. 1 / ISP 5477) TaxID=1933 RepID=A0ABT1HS54_STRSD|nr:ABC transporter permease [Streptoalloteichus tenebrarius]MCP2258347.1 peptide/nickel transport system permease protein [Streptoalloteichus tenebrarius]BFF03513.1 ABC transporter permease [Streptoalloteichus tenebrarius]